MLRPALLLTFLLPALVVAQEEHHHPAPEKLGTVSFPISCADEVQASFNRAVALLHSFAYKEADEGFKSVAQQDPKCAIAYWGSAMTHYHQLWDLPPSPADTAAATKLLAQASGLEASARERAYINALQLVFTDVATVPYGTRSAHYEAAMHDLAAANPKDVETQVFYALALVSNASPTDKEHRRQKQAANLLEPLFRQYPDHPGVPHYLIHACDNQELAQRGLAAARAYATVAPSAPHALHMPSHIFTRLGLWDDSVTSNLAARSAAQRQGDTGEELHAMDYLVYAYLQKGDDANASRMVGQVKAMPNLRMGDFKIGYAATAMPVRLIVERQRWIEAQTLSDPPAPAQPHVVAITVWARGLGLAHNGHAAEAGNEAATLQQLAERLRGAGNSYWTAQVEIMRREVAAWAAQAADHPDDAVAMLRSAADEEDGIEKLPVTPGPIVPAREQLGQLYLAQSNASAARAAFQTALTNSPGRLGSLQGASQAAHPHEASVH